jgi:hypothetical protein
MNVLNKMGTEAHNRSQERLLLDQHHIPNHQSGRRRDKEPGELDQMIGENQPFGEQDKVESEEEKDGRRQHLAELVPQRGAHLRPPAPLSSQDVVRRHGSLPPRPLHQQFPPISSREIRTPRAFWAFQYRKTQVNQYPCPMRSLWPYLE